MAFRAFDQTDRDMGCAGGFGGRDALMSPTHWSHVPPRTAQWATEGETPEPWRWQGAGNTTGTVAAHVGCHLGPGLPLVGPCAAAWSRVTWYLGTGRDDAQNMGAQGKHVKLIGDKLFVLSSVGNPSACL